MPTRWLKTEGEGHSSLLLLSCLGRSEQSKGVGEEKIVERHLADGSLEPWTEKLDEGSWISDSVNDCLPIFCT